MLAYLRIAFLVQSLVFGFLILRTHDVFGPIDPVTTDFVSFYAAGRLAENGTPALVYSPDIHKRVEQQVVGNPKIGYFAFYYPPVYLLICQVLAVLPYLVAFLAWVGATGAAYLCALRPLLPRQAFPVAALAAPAVFLGVASGQNELLSAALFAGATQFVDRRPWLAGVLFGCLCYKPQIAMLVPLALIAGRHGRAFAAAAGTVLVLCGAAWLLYGTSTWRAYVAILPLSRETFENGWVEFIQMATTFASVRLLGGSIALGHAVQGVVSLICAGVVGTLWARRAPLPLRAAALTIGALVAAPVALNYDLVIVGVGMAWLVRDAGITGYRPWEKATLTLAYAGSLISEVSAKALHLLLAPEIYGLLLLIVVLRHRDAALQRPAAAAR